MKGRIRFLANRIGERLWVKPLLMCVVSIVGVFGAKMVDGTGIGDRVPEITRDLLETLLTIMSSSMLVIATFAVASMVSSYASASSTATPRSFTLVVADDVSQNALSTFIGAFIFSIVALIVLKSGYFDRPAPICAVLADVGRVRDRHPDLRAMGGPDRAAGSTRRDDRQGRGGGGRVVAETTARTHPGLRGRGVRAAGGQAPFRERDRIPATHRRGNRAGSGRRGRDGPGGGTARHVRHTGTAACLPDRRRRATG